MLVDRQRVGQLITLSALERTLQGPERQLRESDVAVLVKAAYDDATAEARAAFMQRVKGYPESAWPWSAVAASGTGTARGGGGLGKIIVYMPAAPKTPPALILLMGQAESADADPGDRLPPRGSPEAAEWEPLYKALEGWDTAAIAGYLGPIGWRTPGGTTAGQRPAGDGDTSGAPADDGGRGPSGGSQSGGDDQTGDAGSGPPATQSPSATPMWVWGLAIAGSTAVVVGTAALLLRRPRPRALSLEEELRRGGGAR